MVVHGWNDTITCSTAAELQVREGHTRLNVILSGFLIITLAGVLTAAAAAFLDLDCGLGVEATSGSGFEASPGVGVGSVTLTAGCNSLLEFSGQHV